MSGGCFVSPSGESPLVRKMVTVSEVVDYFRHGMIQTPMPNVLMMMLIITSLNKTYLVPLHHERKQVVHSVVVAFLLLHLRHPQQWTVRQKNVKNV